MASVSAAEAIAGRRIGWIGLGIMGGRMAARVIATGARVTMYARRPELGRSFAELGATIVATPAEVARSSDITITMLSMPSDVEDVYFGPNGLITEASASSVLVDMTTSRPELARRIAEVAAQFGVLALDAPVSGGPVAAEAGTLSIMVGGQPEAFEDTRPLLHQLGTTVVRHGSAGAGQTAKLVNQVVVAGAMLGICEAFALAGRAGLRPDSVMESITSGVAGSPLLRFMWPRLSASDVTPGFRIEHMVKDLGLALELVEDAPIELPGTALTRSLYQRLIDAGFASKGTQALVVAIDPAWKTHPDDEQARQLA